MQSIWRRSEAEAEAPFQRCVDTFPVFWISNTPLLSWRLTRTLLMVQHFLTQLKMTGVSLESIAVVTAVSKGSLGLRNGMCLDKCLHRHNLFLHEPTLRGKMIVSPWAIYACVSSSYWHVQSKDRKYRAVNLNLSLQYVSYCIRAARKGVGSKEGTCPGHRAESGEGERR